MKKVVLNNSGVEKVRLKNLWIYNREIKKIPQNVEPGEIVRIYSPSGAFLAVGYINPASKITVRILSFEDISIDYEFLKNRIQQAYEYRKALFDKTNAFRVVHAEGDFLPGLVVDYYAGYIAVQINTAGMERLRRWLIDALVEVLKPDGILEKSDKNSRQLEGLATDDSVLYGEIPEKITIRENDALFEVNLLDSQKTGFYLDQRKNRDTVSSYVREGFKVLDMFSNTGGFGVHCAVSGAGFVKFVDISPNAASLIEENCRLNNIKNYQVLKEDVFDFVKKELKEGHRYNLVIIDPPPFAKSKNEKEGALRGFKYLFINGLKLLEPGGYMAVFSCSHHISHQDLIDVATQALADTGFVARYVEYLTQDIDHPYIINIPNSLYLKGFILQKVL